MKTWMSTYYYFRQIDPMKKYAEFQCTTLDSFDEVWCGYCSNGEILLIDGKYFLFNKAVQKETSRKQDATVIFKSGRKIVYEGNV